MRVGHRFVLLAGAVLCIAVSYTGVGQRIEQYGYRAAAPLVPAAEPSAAVTVVAIDREALARFGPWPWPRDRIAATLDRLDHLGAETIGVLLPLHEPQTPSALPHYEEQAVGLPAATRATVRGWLSRLDTDRILSESVARAGNVILAAPALPGPGASSPDDSRVPPLSGATAPFTNLALEVALAAPSDPTTTPLAPLPSLAQAAVAIGLVDDGSPASLAGGYRLAEAETSGLAPSFALAVAAHALAYHTAQIARTPLGRLRIGDRQIPTAPDLIFYPRPPRALAGKLSVRVVPLTRLWSPDLKRGAIRGKTIILAPTAPGLARFVHPPGGAVLAAGLWQAHAVAALVNGSWVRVPAWFYGAQRALLLGVCLLLSLLPRRWQGRVGLLAGGGLALVLLNGGLLTLITSGLWLPVVLPAGYALGAQGLLFARHRQETRVAGLQHRTSEALRALAVNLQSQGRLDEAFHHLSRCPPAEASCEPLYQLALEFERRRQFAKALSAYDRIAVIDPGFRDVAERRQRFRTVTSHSALNGPAPSSATTVLLVDDPAVERPVIGRFHIESELGRGAMGIVYRGVDPKIGRKVAIKTLALTEEFEGRELIEVQQRFFREAEAAGRLDHPNVVTIFDVGEEHDLAYIAMDYVEGSSLEAYTHREDLLPVPEVIDVISQVADALAYAHGRQVVHRDIKPGNIIYDRAKGVVKVTDFGIARLTDDSKTKSGSVLGSPAYMSPEQVSGKKVDGRSDLFSLGTTLYQLLTGELPFTGESVSSVLYGIMNQQPKGIRRIRSDLPVALSRVVARSLHKAPGKRFQTGAALAEALRRCA